MISSSSPARRSGAWLRVMHQTIRSLGIDIIRYPARDSFRWELMRLLQQLEINCVLDVGANHGQYARLLREWGYRGEIVSFEPIPEVFASLRQSMAGDPRWRGHPWALGEAETELELNVANGDAQASSFLTFNEEGPVRWGDEHRVARSVRVPVRRLDAVLDQVTAHIASRRMYLKLDTQGFDLRVVAGAGARISEIVALQTEIAAFHFYDGMTSIGDALNRYRDLGFAITGMYPVSRKLDGLQVIEFDCMMMRADRS
jgi:FkbM family methyltransferase